MVDTTPAQRRAYIYARIKAAAINLATRNDFDFSGTDIRINQREAAAAFDALNDAMVRFIDGGCPAEEVQAAWIAYAKAHQLREPEPQSLFGKESDDERSSKLQPVKGKGRGRKRREPETREYSFGTEADDTAPQT
jgi:hypothetical protein